MASEVEEQGVEKQGYFPIGFGSFMPHNPLRLKQQFQASRGPRSKAKQQQLQPHAQPTGHHNKGLRPHKQAISLPNIHVSKLKEKSPRKPTQSLKLLNEISRNDTCSFCHDDNPKKRLLPSLAASCVLPKVTGVVSQDLSWWEWSKKEYRIKQTKFDTTHYEPDVGGFMGTGQRSPGVDITKSQGSYPGTVYYNYMNLGNFYTVHSNRINKPSALDLY